jgi:hypothetical protein
MTRLHPCIAELAAGGLIPRRIDSRCARTADCLEPTLLQDAEQLGLKL